MRRTFLILFVAAAMTAAALATTSSAGTLAHTHTLQPAVTVGSVGNEPLVRVAPNGSVYVSALQHLYLSTNRGRSFVGGLGSMYSTTLNSNSDSSISIDSTGRLYQTFDYPYAGTTAVCTTTNAREGFSCNPAVVPGGTDRMWLAVDPHKVGTSYLVTNEGLYQTVLFESTDNGQTYVPKQTTHSVLDPTDGPLLVSPRTGAIVQPFVENLKNVTATTNFESGPVQLRVFDASGLSPATVERPVPLEAGSALPGAVYGSDGTLYVTSEKAVRKGAVITAVQVRVARSGDDGRTWALLPPLTVSGTATFPAVGAGSAGHVGVVYYRSTTVGDPDVLGAKAKWNAYYAETRNGLSAKPQWTTTLLEESVHVGPICSGLLCSSSNRFAGDFLDTTFDKLDRPYVVWVGVRDLVRFATSR